IYDNKALRTGVFKQDTAQQPSTIRTNLSNNKPMGLSNAPHSAPPAVHSFNTNGPMMHSNMAHALIQQSQLPPTPFGFLPHQQSPYVMAPMFTYAIGFMPHGMLPPTPGVNPLAAMQQMALQQAQVAA